MAKVLWTPSSEIVEKANITEYARWLEVEKLVSPRLYEGLWSWSVANLEAFWESVWDYYRVSSSARFTRVLESRSMPGARWFRGAKLNYAEHTFRGRDPSGTAIISKTESSDVKSTTWGELESRTGAFAETLRRLGVRSGDRVAAYLPNTAEAVIAMLATASIGAVWSSCAPDFGAHSAVDRLKQISPKVLVAADGYSYRGRWYGRLDAIDQMRAAIPSIEQTVMLGEAKGGALSWEDAVRDRSSLRFEQVPFEHPLWVLYSSGTTGLPKPIVQ